MTFVPGVPINVSYTFISGINGAQVYEVKDNRNDSGGFLEFRMQSTSTADSFPTIEMKFNAEEGFVVNQSDMRLSLQESVGLLLSNGTVEIGVNDSGYVVSNPSLFRTAINFETGIEDHEAVLYARTTNPGILGKLWNDGGTLKFSDGTPYVPSLDFQELRNSQYLGTLA